MSAVDQTVDPITAWGASLEPALRAAPRHAKTGPSPLVFADLTTPRELVAAAGELAALMATVHDATAALGLRWNHEVLIPVRGEVEALARVLSRDLCRTCGGFRTKGHAAHRCRCGAAEDGDA